jgi:spoIIIJ-associated protein
MIREAIATASTVDQAKEKALEMLGEVGMAEIEFEVIDLPTKKTFGLFGGSPAKVRAYFDDGRDEIKSEAAKDEKPAAEKKSKPAHKSNANVGTGRNTEKNSAEKSDKSEVREQSDEASSRPVRAASKEESTGAVTPCGKAAEAYLSDVLTKMGLPDTSIIINESKEGAHISLEGNGLGMVIGRRGETLDALQYLVSLACNNEEGGFYRVVLDTGDYREKREATLQALAAKTARQALRSHRNQSLEPMNPYERRIIHTAVQDIEGVTSWSVSDGRSRRVIIGFEQDSSEPVRYDRRSRDNRGGRGGRSGRGGDRRHRPSATVIGSSESKVSDAGSTPLYGRIDK